MAQGKAISVELKTRIINLLLIGRTIMETAKQLNLPTSTVFDVKKKIPAKLIERIETEKKIEKLDNIAEHLEAGLNSQIRIWKTTENREWLNDQSAGDLAMFIGITSDKLFRVLKAISDATENGDPSR